MCRVAASESLRPSDHARHYPMKHLILLVALTATAAARDSFVIDWRECVYGKAVLIF